VIMPIDVSAISSEMTDPLLPENLSKDYKNYFTDNKYNDYPVVGVSFKLAEYFCIWKTENSITQRQFCDPNSKEPYIGFRIVRSYISGKK